MSQEKQNQRKVFAIRLSQIERKTIEAKADLAGLKLGEYIRASALKQKIPPSVPKINRDIYIELIRIGNNINQLARVANLDLKNFDSSNVEMDKLIQLSEYLDRLKLEVLAISPDTHDRENRLKQK